MGKYSVLWLKLSHKSLLLWTQLKNESEHVGFLSHIGHFGDSKRLESQVFCVDNYLGHWQIPAFPLPSLFTCPGKKLSPMIIGSLEMDKKITFFCLPSPCTSCSMQNQYINPFLKITSWKFPTAYPVWMGEVFHSVKMVSKCILTQTTLNLHVWGLINKSVASGLSQCQSLAGLTRVYMSQKKSHGFSRGFLHGLRLLVSLGEMGIWL